VVVDIAIIIPTYNEEKNIKKTLQLVLNQKTKASYEVVVVDGGSQDQTVKIAQKYVRVLESPIKGKAYQLNLGVAQTQSKYLIFLDADTFIPENYVERIFSEFQKDSELWACGAPIVYAGPTHGIYAFFLTLYGIFTFPQFALFYFIWFLFQRLPIARFKIINPRFFFNVGMFIYYTMRQLLGTPEFSGSNICVRRDIFNEIGGFRKPAKLGVDWLFCHLLRTYIREKKRGKMKIIHSMAVETDARHLTLSRSVKRLKTHRDFFENKKIEEEIKQILR